MPAAKGAPDAAAKSRRPSEKAVAPVAGFLTLKHPENGTLKRVKNGFAWDLFLLAPMFGLPLFMRGLPRWGAAILALWLIDLGLGWLSHGRPDAAAMQLILFAAFFLVQLWLGFKGNELTAKAYLARGWTVDHPEFVATRRLLERWGLKE